MTEGDRMSHEEEAFARRIAGPLRRAERLPDDFEARLMAQVEREAAAGGAPRRAGVVARPRIDIPRVDAPRRDVAGAPATGWRRLTSPRTLRVSPLAGLALAAGFAGIVALATARVVTRPSAPVTVARAGATAPAVAPASASAPVAAPVVVPMPTRDTVRLVQFVLVAPKAARVAVVGDFNNWDRVATPLRRGGQGSVWAVDVPLAPGRHQYAFIVDGVRWVLDPTAPRAVEDDFGTPNSVVTVGEHAS